MSALHDAIRAVMAALFPPADTTIDARPPATGSATASRLSWWVEMPTLVFCAPAVAMLIAAWVAK